MKATRSVRRNFIAGLCLVLLGALGFSAKSILVKLAYAASSELDAITLMALRMLFALPIFLLAALWHNKKTQPQPLRKKEWLVVVLLGLDGYYLASYLDFYGLQYISAGLERVILFLYPTFVVLFSALAYRRKITGFMAAALVLTYAGMMLVFIEHVSVESSHLWLGSLLVLISAVVFAGFTMGSGVMVHRIGSSRFTAYTMSAAGVATLIHFALERGMALAGFPGKVYGLAFMMTVFSTVLPAFFMNAGIRRIGADAASIISTTGPIATLVMAFLVLDEAVTGLQLAGTLLVLSGVYVLSRAKSRA
jgi:drug/metabolite transporter (DMT)-like permease